MRFDCIRYVASALLVVVTCCTARGDGSANTWKVTRNVVVGSSGFTNALTTTWQQMTGLSEGERSRIVKQTPDGVTTETVVSFNEADGVETETVQSNVKGPMITRRLHGLEIETESPDGKYFNEYDAFGRVTQVLRASGDGSERLPVCRMEYTPIGDLVKLETFTSATEVVSESYSYDAFGNKVAVTDALGNVAVSSYDPFGQIVSTGGAAMPLRFAYDTRGCRTAMYTTRDGTTWDGTFWRYDPWSQKCVEKRNAGEGITTYTYTVDGLPAKTTYPDGRWVEKTYNAQRKLSQLASTYGTTYQFQYDEFAMPVRVEASTGEVHEFRYGTNSTLTNETVQSTTRTSELLREYDECGRPTGIVHSVGGVFQSRTGYAYDGMNRIQGVSIGDVSGKTFTVAYTNSGGYGCGYEISSPSGIVLRRTLERNDYRREAVVRCKTIWTGGELQFEYDYDALLRPRARNADTFEYDNRGQIVVAHIEGNEFQYGWDDAGNLMRYVFNGVTNTYSANSLNQYASVSYGSQGNATALWYAPNGGLLDDGRNIYTYDAENRLGFVRSISQTNGAIRVRYGYDYRSRRTYSVTEEYNGTSGTWIQIERKDFFYDDWNLIQETVQSYSAETTRVVNVRYYWGCDLSGALVGGGGVGGLVALSRDGEFFFPVYDNLGNVIRYVNESGAVVASYSYTPFGDCVLAQGELRDCFPFRFSTKYFDARIGMYYYDYRYYSPKLMRWLTPDPSEERGGGNLYVFCNNAPVYSFDPNGLIRIPFITDQAKQAWENVIREVLDRRGWNVAALLMRHALKVSPSDLVFSEGSIVSEKIKASPEYRRIINRLIDQQREQFRYYDSLEGIEYKTGDLFAGIGHATVCYRGTICKKNGRTIVDLDITVKDRYDFHFLTDYRKSSLDGVLAVIANNMAWSDQFFDVITPYSWKAVFKERR